MTTATKSKHRSRCAIRAACPAVSEILESRLLLSASLVKDLNPIQNIIPGIWDIEPAGSIFYLAAEDTPVGLELFKSNGTAAGTTLVKDIRPGRDNSQVVGLTYTGNGIVLF